MTRPPLYPPRPCAFVHVNLFSSDLSSCCIADGRTLCPFRQWKWGQPIRQRSGHLGVAKRAIPFREAEVGGDDHASVLVQQVK